VSPQHSIAHYETIAKPGRRMTAWLTSVGHQVNRKSVSRLMEVMGIEAVYPKPKLSPAGESHRIAGTIKEHEQRIPEPTHQSGPATGSPRNDRSPSPLFPRRSGRLVVQFS